MLPEDRLREAEKQTRIAADDVASAGVGPPPSKLHSLADELEGHAEGIEEDREDRDDAGAVR